MSLPKFANLESFFSGYFLNGVVNQIDKRFSENGNQQLSIEEVKAIIDELAAAPIMERFINDARTKMTSRDVAFREAWHDNLRNAFALKLFRNVKKIC